MYRSIIAILIFLFVTLYTNVQISAQQTQTEQKPLENFLTLVLSFGDKNVPDEYLLAQPQILTVNDAGDIYVFDESRIKVYDPFAMENAKKLAFVGIASIDSGVYDRSAQVEFGAGQYKIMYCVDEYDVAKGADALVLLTEWNQFRHLDLPRIAKLMRGKYFFDFRNIYEPKDMTKYGFIYESVGRPRA